jgi:hypothetical protein
MLDTFRGWEEETQTDFVKDLLKEMRHQQHLTVEDALRPYLIRDFISALPVYVSEHILSYLDASSLCLAEQVSKRWRSIILNGKREGLFIVVDGERVVIYLSSSLNLNEFTSSCTPCLARVCFVCAQICKKGLEHNNLLLSRPPLEETYHPKC